MKKYLVILVSFIFTSVQAQQILVPDNVYFADIHLSIDASAREKIQKNVDALLKHPVYFKQKVDRADTYFPIIERIFREAGLPDDFKYLALQESGLVSDAVSTSNAQGFWQFKREAASDYGLKMDQTVDERRHIIEASKAAAKYFIQSNIYYKNWANSLVSYYMGFTGAKAYANPSDTDSKDMRITDKTHIYLLTFLAHKIAFENAIGKNPVPTITLREMRANPGQSLGEIALANQTDPAELEKYNRWLIGATIPADKDYTVLIPVMNATASTVVVPSASQELAPTIFINKTQEQAETKPTFTNLNGLKAIVARAGDTKDKLALAAHISTRKFLRLNDMYSFEQIVPGQVYYLEKKNTRAASEYHVAQPGESLFTIAQMYGMRLKSIVSKNRMKKNEALVAGRVLWLQQTRPANIAVEYRRVDKPVNQKTPETLTQNNAENKPAAEVPVKNNTALDALKETASNTFQKAGHALNVPEKQPEVAKVSTDVFEETLELNKKAEAPKATTAEEKNYQNAIDQEVVAANNVKADIVLETGSVTIPEKPTVTEKNPETNVTTASIPTQNADSASTKNPTLYPKTVAKTPEKVVLTEPTEDLEPEVKTAATPEAKPKATVSTTSEVTKPQAPKIVLKDPATETAKKTVAVSTKKVEATIAAPKPVTPTTHKVAKGETLYSISRKYNVTPADLKFWNKLGEAPLSINQELVITGPAQPVMPVLTISGPDKPVAENTTVIITHKVGEGESMYQISRKYGVSIKEIMEWNNKADFNVSAGDELTIRSRPDSSRN